MGRGGVRFVIGAMAMMAATASCSRGAPGPTVAGPPSAPHKRESARHELTIPEGSAVELASHVFAHDETAPGACTALSGADLARCLIAERYAEAPEAHRHARALFDRVGVVPGIDPARTMDDGDYRGRVELAPAFPVQDHTPHLSKLTAAFDVFDRFFDDLARGSTSPVRFWFRGVGIKFYRTIEARSPSAYVESTNAISYNVDGELFDTEEGVRDTIFHELFHINDTVHGNWSNRELAPLYAMIVARCVGVDACLDDYAPHETKVDGGIYYAFHPTSSVREYAAELAIRYLREQLAASVGEPIERPFKCLTPENRLAWEKLAREFFGGVDRVPACTGST